LKKSLGGQTLDQPLNRAILRRLLGLPIQGFDFVVGQGLVGRLGEFFELLTAFDDLMKPACNTFEETRPTTFEASPATGLNAP
jgi:hypothetical protein